MSRRARTIAVILVAFVLWISAGAAARALRPVQQAAGILPGERAGAEAVAYALGGFRGLVSNFLWLRGTQLQQEGRYEELNLLYNLILDLQPRFTGVWSYMAWNFAYNLAYEANTPEERWRWIETGIDLLEEDGIRRNPHTYQLFYELGYTYYFRTSRRSRDPFYRHYQERLAPPPDWVTGRFDFVDKGLWADDGTRYRLYRGEVGPGEVALGGGSSAGGSATRAERTYFVIAHPASALESVMVGGVRLRPEPLAPGARLHAARKVRVGESKRHSLPHTPVPEPTVPDGLAGAALIALPDTVRGSAAEDLVRLTLSAPAEIYLGFVPDEKTGFVHARKWLLEAEKRPDLDLRVVPRLRVHALVEIGDWEQAYVEFAQLFETRIGEEDPISTAFLGFLRFAVYVRWTEGRREEAELWHKRLRTFFPSWTIPPAETAEWVQRNLTAR